MCVCVSAVNNKKGDCDRGKLACYANAEGRKAKSAKPQMEEMDANMHEREREALIGRICVRL